ncbi:Uncharacterized protein conserved in bacteria [Salmonella enterica subsp. enterica]|uniref:Uncharacterized protein conserved in bacteria n=1 Tax=Salmonella enterica I TaxID=59201 RepID=A0A379WXG3_SALET|nr:Uncharacterized protein conserved in bacteria [Salmonella enterica subsp. enterica]
MPHWDDERDGLSQSQAENLMLDNSARSLGIFREQWLADYYRLKRPDLKGWRESRAEQQQIIPVEVETFGRMWLHADLLSQLEPALNNALKATHSAVLSPFDPVVWIASGQRSFSDLTIGWSVIRPQRSASTVILCCRYYTRAV